MRDDMSQVLVTGDWVCDWNLQQLARSPRGYYEGTDETQMHIRPGGAWYLTHLLQRLLNGEASSRAIAIQALQNPSLIESTRVLERELTATPWLCHAYSLWSFHDRIGAVRSRDLVWRVGQLLGCRRAREAAPFDRELVSAADWLVIDDLNLGFSDLAGAHQDRSRGWNHLLDAVPQHAQVLLKQGIRKAASPLWTRLLTDSRKFSERLTVVVAASALRHRNAALSRALSWDQSLEEIRREFTTGPSSHDLARIQRVVVHFGVAGAAVFESGKFKTLVFLPDELEGAYEEERPGYIFGTASVIAAVFLRHLLSGGDYPRFFALSQALAAQRMAIDIGAGQGRFDVDLAFGEHTLDGSMPSQWPGPCDIIRTPQEGDRRKKPLPISLTAIARFRAAWSQDELPTWTSDGSGVRSELLANVVGGDFESLVNMAQNTVLRGIDAALNSIPKARYGKYVTVDREEIERINEIRRLILNYRKDAADRRPLSIAVFGAPGCGKSFAIKEVSRAIFGKEKEPLEFNLTQIRTAEDLHRAFQQVRDASIRNEIPLVFWDEFDADRLRWLADFLAPMQDAEFFDGSHKHPFGKAIFIFAGGTCSTFEQFKSWPKPCPGAEAADETWSDDFKTLKGPDFISRLRGFVNVKGPNPTNDADQAHLLRRAMILRGELERDYPHLIDPATNRAEVAPEIVLALLRVRRYKHGARSISAILKMSSLAGARFFTISALPARNLLDLHLTDDFEELLSGEAIPRELLEELACASWIGWCEQKLQQGYAYGPQRNDDPSLAPLTHPDLPANPPESGLVDAAGYGAWLQHWNSLPESTRQKNRDPVPQRMLFLREQLCCRPVLRDSADSDAMLDNMPLVNEQLCQAEHYLWLREHLVQGWEQAPHTNDNLRLHTDVGPYQRLTPDKQNLSRSIMGRLLNVFDPSRAEGKYVLCQTNGADAAQ